MSETTTAAEPKVKVRSIRLERAEGTSYECAHPREARSWAEADGILFAWGNTAPGPGGGYHKCDFAVTFEDGETYRGRFDLKRGGRDDSGLGLRSHVRAFLTFNAGESRPFHFTPEEYARWVEGHPELAAECRRWLARYDI